MAYKDKKKQKENSLTYYLKNKDKILKYQKEYYRKTWNTMSDKKKNSIKKRNKLWYIKNKERIREHRETYRNEAYLKKVYNLTKKEYFKKYKEQKERCSICKKPPKQKRWSKLPLVVDHCHETKKVRGLLCSECNILIGLAKDNTDILINAIKYLNKWRNKE